MADETASVGRTPEEIAATIAKLQAETALALAGADRHRDEAAFARAQAAVQAIAEAKAGLEFLQYQDTVAFDRGQNKRHRVYDFVTSVSSGSVESAMDTIGRWRRQSSEPITVCFNSPGGSVIDGLRLYDYLLAVRQDCRVTTVTLGMAASMAGVLLQAGTRRVVGPNAYLLIHEVSAGAIGKLSEMEDETKFYRRVNTRLFDILAERAKVSKATIAANAKRKDWWIDGKDAVEKYGFADAIGFS